MAFITNRRNESIGDKWPNDSTFLQKDWQKQILYIPQAPYIFQDTLANNIRFYTPEATDEAIQQAIQLVGLDELVKDLPEGIHTLIGESGRMLSGDKHNE